MGIVSSIGHDIAAFGRSLADGRSGIRRLSRHTVPELPTAIGADIAGFDLQEAVGQVRDLPDDLAKAALRLGRRSPFAIQTSIAAALQAWRQASLHDREISPERIALVIAGHNTTQDYVYSLYADFVQHPEYLSPRYALQFMDSNQIGVLSEIFDIKGEGIVAGGASASGNVGIIQGARLIQAGFADACLVVGVVAELSPMEIQGFHNIGAMGGRQFHDEPEKACRPFDAAHGGFIHGQAAAAVVLESGATADGRKAIQLATLRGGSINLHATASAAPDLEGEAKAMNAALRESGIDVGDVDYVNTHGTSSPLGDEVEIQAIEQVFGDHFPRVWLNATKGLTGHCLWSAGIVEIIACVVQLQQGFVHPNKNLEHPINPRARFAGARAVREQVHIAMSNSFGFGGINSSIVVQKCD